MRSNVAPRMETKKTRVQKAIVPRAQNIKTFLGSINNIGETCMTIMVHTRVSTLTMNKIII